MRKPNSLLIPIGCLLIAFCFVLSRPSNEEINTTQHSISFKLNSSSDVYRQENASKLPSTHNHIELISKELTENDLNYENTHSWTVSPDILEVPIGVDYEYIPLYSDVDSASDYQFPLENESQEFAVFSNVVYGNFLDRVNVDDSTREQIHLELDLRYKLNRSRLGTEEYVDVWFLPGVVMKQYLSDSDLEYFYSFQFDLLKRESDLYEYLNMRANQNANK